MYPSLGNVNLQSDMKWGCHEDFLKIQFVEYLEGFCSLFLLIKQTQMDQIVREVETQCQF